MGEGWDVAYVMTMYVFSLQIVNSPPPMYQACTLAWIVGDK